MTPDRELWFEEAGRVALRDAARREPAAGEVRARAIASGVSRGTELLLLSGEGPTPFDPSVGVTAMPCRYGYAWVGEVERAGAGARLSAGERVFGLLPHASAHVVSADRLRPLPAGIWAERATLAANLETALNCVWDARISIGDELLVLGGGVVGLLVAYAASRAGAVVTVVEPSQARREAAVVMGAARAVAPDAADALGESFDAVVEATGRPESLDRAIALAGVEARVVVASFYGARRAPVALGEAFHRRRLALVSSQVSRIPADRAPRWSFDRRFQLVVELLADPRLDILIDAPTPFEESPALYSRLRDEPLEGIHPVLVY